MGMTARSLLWRVELPIAVPVIVGGIRSASVQIIATATLAAIFGGRASAVPRRGLCPAELPDDGRRRHLRRASSCSRSSSSPSPSASSHRPACSRRRGGDRAAEVAAARRLTSHRGQSRCNGTECEPFPNRPIPTPGCQRDRWYCRGSSRQPQRAISLRRTQCGCSARSPLGRRCWCCSAPARRVGAASRRSRSARMDSTRRASSPRSMPGPRGRRLHGRSGRHRTRHTGRHQRGARERPDRPQAGVSRQRSRQARARNADHQSGHQQAAAPGALGQQGRRDDRPRLHAGPGHERASSSARRPRMSTAWPSGAT